MTVLIKQLIDLIKLLHSDTGTVSLALGLSLGLWIGLSPILSLQGLLFLSLLLVFRIQMGAAFLSGFFFSFIAYLIDPLCHALGSYLLSHATLIPYWEALYNMPLVPLTRFNNSVVMGSGVLGIILTIPAYFLFYWLVQRYRSTILAKCKESTWWKAFQLTTIYKWYTTYDSFKS